MPRVSQSQQSTQAVGHSDHSHAPVPEPKSEQGLLSQQLASTELSLPENLSLDARTVSCTLFSHIESLTLTFLPQDRYLEPPPGMTRRFYPHQPTWHLGYIPQSHSSEYISELVDLTTKALSCLLENLFYKQIQQNPDRINALSRLKAFTQSSKMLNDQHKILLDTFLSNASKIETKACQLLYSARKAGVNLQHQDELFPLIMDGIFHHVGRHAFDNAPNCMMDLLDGIQAVFEHAQKGLFITEPLISPLSTASSSQQEPSASSATAVEEAVKSNRETAIDTSVRYLKKINKLVGGPGEFSFSSFPINTDNKSNFSIAALKEIVADARIVCSNPLHRQQTAAHFKHLDLEITPASICIVDEKKPLRFLTTEGKRWLLTANTCDKQVNLYFPDSTENIRPNEARRLFGQFYAALDKAKEGDESFRAECKARIQLLQGLDRSHLFKDGNGRNNICVNMSICLMLGHSLKMPRKVSDYARFTVEELYQREQDCNPPDHAFDLIAICSKLKLTHIVSYLLDFQRQWLIENQDITHQLQAACRIGDIQTARELIEQGADINSVSNALLWQPGTTALNEAIKSGDYALVKDLLDSGANINLTTRDGILPFDTAADYDFTDIATLLMFRNGKMSTLPGDVDPDWYR